MFRASSSVTGIAGIPDPGTTAGAFRIKAARRSGRLGSRPAIKARPAKLSSGGPTLPFGHGMPGIR